MISERMYVAMAMVIPQTICAICQIKFCLRCAAAFTHIMTKNTYCNILPQRILLQNNFIKKHRKSAKKRTVKRLSEWASITQLTREPHNPLGIILL